MMVQDKQLVNRINLAKYIPIGLIFLLNIVFYFLIRGKVSYKIAEPFWAALAGWAAVYFLYTKNLLTKFDKTPKLLERFYNNVLAKIYEKFAKAMNFIDVKVFGNYKPLILASKCGVKTAGWIEKNIMNKSVSLTADFTRKLSLWDMKLQSRNVQSYNAYAFILLTVIISLVIIAYKVILSQIS